jgi:hypothetical protein
MIRSALFLFCIHAFLPAWHSQSRSEVLFIMGGDSSTYIRLMGTIQVWTRYTDNNPGSALSFGTTFYPQPSTFDIGIRRARFQVLGPVAKRCFFYSQFGLNNFTYHSPRKQGAFFHDLSAEYVLVPGILNIGGGLTGWSGLARYASPAVASTLMYDAPLFEQATNDINDQFLRKLSLFAKGKISRLDYRLALGKPMPIQQSVPAIDTSMALQNVAAFSPAPPRLQSQAYFNWQFLDSEENLTPYTTGSYFGTKRILNVGSGMVYQPEAMRHLVEKGDIVRTPLLLLGADLFVDYALNKTRRDAVTAYGGWFRFDYGPNYVRPLGVMNTVNASTLPSVSAVSGFGNGFPMNGTGEALYLQAGYLFRHDLLRTFGTLQPYADLFYAAYEALADPVVVWNAGVNWLLNGTRAKISLNFQSRPVFERNGTGGMGREIPHARRGMLVLQYQAAF